MRIAASFLSVVGEAAILNMGIKRTGLTCLGAPKVCIQRRICKRLRSALYPADVPEPASVGIVQGAVMNPLRSPFDPTKEHSLGAQY